MGAVQHKSISDQSSKGFFRVADDAQQAGSLHGRLEMALTRSSPACAAVWHQAIGGMYRWSATYPNPAGHAAATVHRTITQLTIRQVALVQPGSSALHKALAAATSAATSAPHGLEAGQREMMAQRPARLKQSHAAALCGLTDFGCTEQNKKHQRCCCRLAGPAALTSTVPLSG